MRAKCLKAYMGDVCEINPRDTGSLERDSKITFVPMSAVDEKTASIQNAEVREYQEVMKGYTPFKENDVLFAKITPCMENGKCAIARHLRNRRGFGSTEFHILRASEKIIPEWIFYYLRQEEIRRQAAKSMTGTAGQQRVPRGFIERLQIPLPSLPIQKNIAAILEKADAAREKRWRANRLTEEFLRSAFLEMFGDPGFEKRRFPLVKLGSLGSGSKGDIRFGPFGSQLKIAELVDEGIQVLGIENIGLNELINHSKKFISPQKYEQLKGFTVFPGDVIVTGMGTLGRVCVIPYDYPTAIISSHLFKITPNMKLVNPVYLSSCFTYSPYIKNQIERHSHGAIMAGLNTTILKGLLLYLPPLKLQERFAHLVEKVEALRTKQRKSEQELDDLFHSLMQRAFRGELVE